MKQRVSTELAPQAIGTYSQAIRTGNTVYLSGQIPLDPKTMTLVPGDIRAQTEQVWANLVAVATAAGATSRDFVKLTVYLTDLKDFAVINAVLAEQLQPPYPARAVVGVQALPRDATVEIEAIAVIPPR